MNGQETLAWLENLPLAAHIGETWWFPLLESLHVIGSMFVVGSIAMVDLRLLGVSGRGHAVARLTREILPWTWGAFTLAAVTGAGMFISQATRYAGNPAFQLKLVLLVLAGVNMAVYHLRFAPGTGEWDVAGSMPRAARVAGGCSLTLWVGITLAGRWIGHLS